MFYEVRQAELHRLRVRLPQIVERLAAVHLEGADGSHEHYGARVQARGDTLDVEELFRAQVEAEAGFGDAPVAQRQRHLRRDDGVGPLGDVREGAAVYEGRRTLDGLDEVGLERVAQQDRHRARGAEVARVHRLPLIREADEDVAEAALEVAQVLGQAEDSHNLRGRGDVEEGLVRHAVGWFAEADDDVAKLAVVDVEDPAPPHAARVEHGLEAPVDVVVDHRGEEVVRRADGVYVAREVKVDILHRQDLAFAAAGRPALHPERRAQARLAEREAGALAQSREAHRQADGGRRLPLPGRRGRYRRDEDEPIAQFIPPGVEDVELNLGLIAAV